MTEQLRIFTVDGCQPCHDVAEALASENFEVLGIEGDVEIQTLDLEDESNYEFLNEVGLEAIPSAYHGLQQCHIFIDEDTRKVTFDCRPPEEEEEEEEEADAEEAVDDLPGS